MLGTYRASMDGVSVWIWPISGSSVRASGMSSSLSADSASGPMTTTIFGWMTAFQPVVGDAAYAMQLVAASPASVYLGGLPFDLQSMGIWSAVGIGGWLISENGWLGHRLAATRLRLP